jgi:hypothetical protein
MYMTGSAGDSPGYMPTQPSLGTSTQFSAFHPPINVAGALGSPAFMPPVSTTPATSAASTSTPNGETNESDDSIDDPKLHEAMKLVQ